MCMIYQFVRFSIAFSLKLQYLTKYSTYGCHGYRFEVITALPELLTTPTSVVILVTLSLPYNTANFFRTFANHINFDLYGYHSNAKNYFNSATNMYDFIGILVFQSRQMKIGLFAKIQFFGKSHFHVAC